MLITGGSGMSFLPCSFCEDADWMDGWNIGGDANSMDDSNPLWTSEFKTTNAYDVWERTTDSLLFDIVEPR